MKLRSARICSGALVVAALTAAGVPMFPAPTADATAMGNSPTAVTAAIDAVTTLGGDDAGTHIPVGFGEAYYSPTVEHGILVNPDGDCSSPIPLPDEFDSACKAHDLGYDLLRFGWATGRSGTENDRRQLDETLRDAMQTSCQDRSDALSRDTCSALGEVAFRAVAFNSWRQAYGPPVREPALPFLIGGGILAALLAVFTALASRKVST